MEFEKGDIVKRIEHSYNGMKYGDKDEVVNVISSLYRSITLKNFGKGHSFNSLRVIERGCKNWKDRIEGSD